MILNTYGFGPGSHLGLPDQDAFFTWLAEEWSRQAVLESVLPAESRSRPEPYYQR
jgi:hypothetical protein